MSKQFLLKVPAIIFALVIFVLSQIPAEMLPPKVFDLQDKLLHLLAYFLFGITLVIATITMKNKRKRIVLIILFGSLYALLDEVHQMFVPGRYWDLTDWFADTLGVFLALFFVGKIRLLLEKFLKIDFDEDTIQG
ncbi:MAG: VanZ family protein [Candidatus Kapaibacteriota bacterium]